MNIDYQLKLRKLFQIFAIGIFLFQIQNSLRKYHASPVVQQRSLTTIDSIRKPSIYVCEDNQFNYTKAQAFGYSGMIDFSIGELMNSDKKTWLGKHGNLTFEELLEYVFDSDYSRFISMNSETEKLYIFPHGFCMKLADHKFEQYIKSDRKTMLLMVDPHKETDIRIVEMQNGRVYARPISKDLFDSVSYTVDCQLHDSKIYNGQSCTDHKIMNSSYGQCIESIMSGHLVKCYGCLPPWFPTQKGLTCESEKAVAIQDTAICKRVFDEFISLFLGRDLKMFKPCLPDCLKMSLQLKQTSNSYGKKHTRLSIFTSEQVDVIKDTYSYDLFNLVVDIGSSLGLWLGLSALNIFDNFIIFCGWLSKKKYTN